ncbi:MAG TPA: hypothetical protein PKY88_00795 [Anaerohalosphaeraceae bacterium]|nr:hypothetical protein [Anaerohalosphaeraceae bacterium]
MLVQYGFIPFSSKGVNPFGPTSRYTDGMNAYEYVKSFPLLFFDAEGPATIPYWPIGPGCGPMYPINLPTPESKSPCVWRFENFAWEYLGNVGYYLQEFKIPNPYPDCGAGRSGRIGWVRMRYPLDDSIWKHYAKPEGCECIFRSVITYRKWCCNRRTSALKREYAVFNTFINGKLKEEKDFRGSRRYRCSCDFDPSNHPVPRSVLKPTDGELW